MADREHAAEAAQRPEGAQNDVRRQTASVLADRLDTIAADAVAIIPFTDVDTLDPEYCGRLGRLLARLLSSAIRDGGLDPRGGLIATLRTVALERSVSMERLFALAYLVERTALDELALSQTLGVTSEAWPLVAQLARRGSFDLLSAFAARAQQEPGGGTIVDALTTLHTRPVFDAVLLKESERAARSGEPFSLILFDVDRLATINELHGYSVGDRILERLGTLMRRYFRHHDWIARHSDDAIGVLLTGPDAVHAADLADRARTTVADRLGFTDHRTGQPVPVTVSAAVVTIRGGKGTAVDPERLLTEAESALLRAKRLGRNRVEVVAGSSTTRTPPRSSPSA
jgi:diguanylate cyclase (GGDEF)-like protein